MTRYGSRLKSLTFALLVGVCATRMMGCTCNSTPPSSKELSVQEEDKSDGVNWGIVAPPPQRIGGRYVSNSIREMLAPTQAPEMHRWVIDLEGRELEAYVESNPSVVRQLDAHGRTALHWAVRLGRPNAAGLLIRRGADLDIKDNDLRSPLDFLMDALQRVSSQDVSPDDLASLMQVAAQGAPVAFSQLSRGHEECARLLIASGADLNCTDGMGRTPVFTAVRGGHANILSILIESGADLNHEDRVGWNALEYARKAGFEPLSSITEMLNNAIGPASDSNSQKSAG